MKPRALVLFALLSGLLAAGPLLVARTESVAISSTAAPFYVRSTGDDGKPRPETYIFTQGHNLTGNTADASQAKMKFDTITRYLSVNLAKQNYFPSTDPATANLIIAVSWGTTEIYEDPRDKQAETEKLNEAVTALNEAVAANGMADAGVLNQSLASGDANTQGQQSAISRNAALLGYSRSLKKERRNSVPTQDELRMSIELNEERYFVILMAYDYQFMRKEKKSKLLWVTRLSLRSPGNNFTEAMPTLAVAGGDVFGKALDGLTRVKVPVQTGKVILHDLEVLGTDEKKAATSEEKAK